MKKTIFAFVFCSCIIFSSCKKQEPATTAIDLPPPPPPPPPPQYPPVSLCSLSVSVFADLSTAKTGIAVATTGNKILFAGGYKPTIITATSTTPGEVYSRVDIYDMALQTWSTAELSQPYNDEAAVVAGNKIFFTHGWHSTRVDIYDAATNSWSTTELSFASGGKAIATAGNKVFFAGGMDIQGDASNIVDIYDIPSNTWSVQHLSEGKHYATATAIGNKIYFSGGLTGVYDSMTVSDKIDIYDAGTNSWSADVMGEPRAEMAMIAAGDIIFWAGGINDKVQVSDKVEMYNIKSGIHSSHKLPEANAFYKIVRKNDKILFYAAAYAYNNKAEVFDITAQTWSTCSIPQAITQTAVVSAGNKVYLAGGYVNNTAPLSNHIWLLDL